MSAEVSHEALLKLGLRITSSRDLEQARWLLRTAGVQALQAAAHDLSSRRMPRPRKVIEYLGLERRTTPRPDLPAVRDAMAHARWRAGGCLPGEPEHPVARSA